MKRNRVVLVTGGASGIGLATAKKFASHGDTVVLVDLNPDKLEMASKEMKASGASEVMTSVCNVADENDVMKTVNEAMKRYGQINVIVNNAGLMVFKSLVEHTKEDWDKVLNVDLLGAFYFIREAFRTMKDGGVIVNISSIHAIETTPHVASYAAAKAAVVSLTRSAAIEGKEKGIRVNAVLPGAIDTPMLWSNPNIKAGLEVINQSDVGKPEDIAAAVFHLASEDSKFIQGTELRVDGGRLAKL